MVITSIRVIVGIIGSAVCVLLYAVPALTFKRVIKEASVGEFSCLPYILALFSALTWGWYGFPVVSNGWENLSLFGTCAIGVLFEFSFIIIYIWYAPREKKKQVIKTKSVEFMPFYLSLFSLLTSFMWTLYGVLGRDPYLTAPNSVGCLTGILQLVVYCIYSRCKEPPKALNDIEQVIINLDVATSRREDINGCSLNSKA
ncbi:hypothetical protein GQ55_3G074000 [Panicum hallii var. hallii]|uniref:Bidirectional sugar transporter SWEET n=1 Tax=Panicum hallii var. hallii TaxID=1504633 RepID=A0A2T7E6R1_9POAL|nr:hypothetical protein GQ55_3G074000 [Panicum hallii var. hallii]